MKNWQGKKVLVLGAARQGLSAARFLAGRQANVVLNDQRPESAFIHISKELGEMGVRTCFGGHPTDLIDGVDIVCVSGGVPLDNPIVQKAKIQGIELSNDSQIFFETVNARVIGITGSAGKTTTTILVGEIAKRSARKNQKVWVGGNIGQPMLDHVEEIGNDDWVILELSSFQLELMSVSPAIAVILNITPNHLDRHKTMENYIAAKARILQFQNEKHHAILNRDDINYGSLLNKVRGSIITFGRSMPEDEYPGVFIENDSIVYEENDLSKNLVPPDCLHLPGEHNRMNLLAACAVSIAAGFPPAAMREGVERVSSIPHRLELVREVAGVRWINDSIATAPERVIAALRAIQSPLVLLLGGRDKDLPWEDLAVCLRDIKPRVILFGEAANMIHAVLQRCENGVFPYSVYSTKNLEKAVKLAYQISQPGDTVLLSPGGTSFDAYADFEERGRHFREMVEAFA